VSILVVIVVPRSDVGSLLRSVERRRARRGAREIARGRRGGEEARRTERDVDAPTGATNPHAMRHTDTDRRSRGTVPLGEGLMRRDEVFEMAISVFRRRFEGTAFP
jgi:hypothetical protein